MLQKDWRDPVRKFLTNAIKKTKRTIKYRSTNYVLLSNDLYRKTSNSLLLLCIGKAQSMTVMGKIHEGICGSYQLGEKNEMVNQKAWLLLAFD